MLRIELFLDVEAGSWYYRVPALHINVGGLPSRHDAEQDCLSAIAFRPGGQPADYDPTAEALMLDLLGPVVLALIRVHRARRDGSKHAAYGAAHNDLVTY